MDGEASCAAHLDPFCPLFSASWSRSWPRARCAPALVGLGSPTPSGKLEDLTSNCLRSPKISTEAFSEAAMSCFAQLKKNSSTGRTGTPAGPKTRDENMSGTRLILVQNCTQFRSRLPSRGPPCSRCPEAARVKDRPRCAIHSPKLNGEPCATLAQPWLPVWWHNSAEILQNSCRTSLRLHIRA